MMQNLSFYFAAFENSVIEFNCQKSMGIINFEKKNVKKVLH